MLNDFHLPKSDSEDLIDGKYYINVSEPIRELSNNFVTYYNATNVVEDYECFAIVFSQIWNPIELIEILQTSEVDNVIKPLVYGITTLSHTKSETLVAIVEHYDYKNTLAKMISEETLSLNVIENSILKPFIALFKLLNQNSLSCGNVNPENILFLNDKFVLREPFIAPPNYYQNSLYVPYELENCHRVGMNTNDSSSDIFALGCVAFLAHHGFNNMSEQYYFENRLKYGALQTFLNMYKQSMKEDYEVYRIIAAALSPNIDQRMSLINWDTSKQFFLKDIQVQNKDSTLFFCGERYNFIESLLSAMIQNWDVANTFVNDDVFLKSLKNYHIPSNIYDSIQNVITNDQTSRKFNSFVDQYKLTKVLQLLRDLPILHLRSLSICVDSLPQFAILALINQKEPELSKLDIILKDKLYMFFHTDILNKSQKLLDRLINLQYKSGNNFFGFERLIYTTNPYLPCLSKLVDNKYIIGLEELLIELENFASLASEQIFWDSHLIGFLTSKLGISNTDAIFSSQGHELSFTKDNTFFMLLLISKTQKLYPKVSIANVAQYICEQISVLVMDEIHNSNLRKVVSGQIIRAGEEQNLTYVIELISNGKIYQNDKNGYLKARTEVSKLTAQINDIEETTETNALFWAQKVTVVVSYVLCLMIGIGLVI